ncbi:MAG: hypothetical protein ACYSUD_19060, partial [Planctomycetota bacterium]
MRNLEIPGTVSPCFYFILLVAISAIIAWPASAICDIFSDDFEDGELSSSWTSNPDGTITPVWIKYPVVPGITITEENGQLRSQGIPTDWGDAGITTYSYDGREFIDASV